MKKSTIITTLCLPMILLCSCGTKISHVAIEHELEFGGIYIKETIEDFNNKGFAFGDSVDVKFSNGYTLKDLPYYNGYYVDAGEALLVGYPGYDYIKVTLNYGDDLWFIGELSDSDTATVKLNKKEKYKDVQVASDIHYYDERERYTSDVIFANYRNIKMGDIKNNILYRSASPCDNKHKRASYVDTLMAESGIQFILNLADTKAKIDGYIAAPDFNSPYFLSLYQNQRFFLSFSGYDEKVEPLALNMNYMSDDFAKKVGSGFKNMINSDGPYLVHCLEGKDRTGFVCIVLEALMGGLYQEIVDDYMLTYDNYYGIKLGDPRYDTIKARNVDSMLRFLCGGNDYTSGDLSGYIKSYLTTKGEMTEAEVNSLINKLKA